LQLEPLPPGLAELLSKCGGDTTRAVPAAEAIADAARAGLSAAAAAAAALTTASAAAEADAKVAVDTGAVYTGGGAGDCIFGTKVRWCRF
jgi:hypothetical protein